MYTTYLCPLNDDSVCRQVDSPGQRGSRHQDLDVLVSKQLLHQSTIYSVHASMMDGKTIGKKIL